MTPPSQWQPNHLEAERLDKVTRLEAQGVNPYPARVNRSHTIGAAVSAFVALEQAGKAESEPIAATLCGRIRRVNIKGKLSFLDIEDESGRVQLFMRINNMDAAQYALVQEKLVAEDDFVQTSGTMTRTKTGEISLSVTAFTLIAKSLSPLPVVKQQVLEDGTVREYGEFTNVEARYRQRYADLAVNKNVREVFLKRAKVIRAVRDFMDNEGFLEVETPILQALYGGAAARPFITHHNQLDQDLYLRISFELYLKRLLVGGIDAVYEIGRDFRNEGVSWKHNPEFTMMEFYKAYIDYNGVMDITERMFATVAQSVTGQLQLPFKGHMIDYTPNWRRVTMRQAILEQSGIDYMDAREAPALEALIREQLAQHHAKGEWKDKAPLPPNLPWGKLVSYLFDEFVEKTLVQPTFILDYPRDISPFAKRVSYDDLHVERFEFFIAGMEMGNAFTELNDARDQEARFLDMAETFNKGDDDETLLDEDYLRAMRYGMPPNGGWGMGIDRLVMLMTDQHTIRDVLLYPHLRDEE